MRIWNSINADQTASAESDQNAGSSAVAARKKEMMYLFLVLFAPALGAAPEDVKELAKEVLLLFFDSV